MRSVFAFGVVFLLGTLAGGLAASSDRTTGGQAEASTSSVRTPTAPVVLSPAATATASPGATMTVSEGDMFLRPTSSTTLPAGPITFTVTNDGTLHHEFVIVSGDPTGTKGDEPSTVSEANHIGGPFGPEIGDLHPGVTRTVMANLAPGTYTAMCNYPGHFAAGMHFQFVVTPSAAVVATMTVTEGDMYLRRTSSTTLPAGTIAFTVTNHGPLHHEFVIVSGDPTGTKGDEPSTVSEANHVGGPKGPEISDLHPGQTRTVRVTLAPGTYTAMCNYPGHFAAGMHFQFVVQ
jgi:uncharacterized cupredoxin-like copper-binding protein